MLSLKRFESVSEKWFSSSSPSFNCSSSISNRSDYDFRESFHMLTQRVRYNMKRIWKIEHTIDTMDSDFTDLSADYWSPHLRMVVIEISREFRCSVSKKLRKIFLRHGATKPSVSTKPSFFRKQTSKNRCNKCYRAHKKKVEYSPNWKDSKTKARNLKLDYGIETAQTANNTSTIEKKTFLFLVVQSTYKNAFYWRSKLYTQSVKSFAQCDENLFHNRRWHFWFESGLIWNGTTWPFWTPANN